MPNCLILFAEYLRVPSPPGGTDDVTADAILAHPETGKLVGWARERPPEHVGWPERPGMVGGRAVEVGVVK